MIPFQPCGDIKIIISNRCGKRRDILWNILNADMKDRVRNKPYEISSCQKPISLNELLGDTQQFRTPPKIAINSGIRNIMIANGDKIYSVN